MSTPPALLGFFQQEALEYLDRLDQLLAGDPAQAPHGASFLAQSRALRGAATMTRLGGLPEFCSTLERLASGVRDGELRWDQRVHFATRGALVEIRALVQKVNRWGDAEQRQARTYSVALAAVATGYLATVSPSASPSSPVLPISRLFPDDGAPGLVERNATPPITLAERFRGDMAAAADGVARESANLASGHRGVQQLALTDALRRTLLGLTDVAESYGAASIAGLAMRMARSGLDRAVERVAIQGFAQLLMDRELSDHELAARVREQATTWPGSGAALPSTSSATPTPIATATFTPVTPTSLPPVMVAVRGAPATPIARTPISAAPIATPASKAASGSGGGSGAGSEGRSEAGRRTPAPYVPRAVTPASANARTGSAADALAAARALTPNRDAARATPGGTAPQNAGVVAIETLLYSGTAALDRAREVRDQLQAAWLQAGGAAIDPTTAALLDELSDLLDLAATP